MLEKYLTWFKAHERLLIVALVLGVGVFGFNKWIDHEAQVKHDDAIIAQQTLNTQDASNKALAAQIALQQEQFTQTVALMNQEISVLQASINQRDTVAAKKVVEVTAPKTSQQAVDDLNAAYTLPAPVTVSATGAEVPTVDLQSFTVAKIEGDTAKADLIDTQKQLTDTKTELTSATGLVTSLQGQVSGLQTARKEDDTAWQAKLDAQVAADRKGKRKWLVIGFIAGIGTRVLLKW